MNPGVVSLLLASVVGEAGNASDEAFFERRIRPVLVEHCVSCHSPPENGRAPKGGLRLDFAGGWERGGDRGPAILRGDADASLLVRAIRYDDQDLQMPPKGKLPPEVIADFERWVARGAHDPRKVDPAGDRAPPEKTIDPADAARLRWAFSPPVSPAVPTPTRRDWARTDVDRFILARLEAESIEPVGDADPADLIRRATVVLTGLPPLPEDLDAFVSDPSPVAWEKVVDRLLASPRFGERWGRHWLDVARFAESSGGGRSVLFHNAWRYRDYVIDAFSFDKPFDEFVREQLAGDLIHRDGAEAAEALIATGFLAVGPKNLDQQHKELLRMEVVDEQIDTIGRAFMGLTLGCARCHDHKFDPVTTRDYYALAGIFRSTKTLLPGNVSGFVETALPNSDGAQLDELWRAHRAEAAKIDGAIKKARSALAKTKADRASSGGARGVLVDDRAARLVGKWVKSTHHPAFVGEGYLHDDNSEKGRKSISFPFDVRAPGNYEIRVAYTPGSNRAKRVPVLVEQGNLKRRVHIDETRPPPLGKFVSIGMFEFAAGSTATVTLSNSGTRAHVIADAVLFVPPEEVKRETPSPQQAEAAVARERLAVAERAARTRLEQLEKRKAEHAKRAPPPIPKAMAVRDEDEIADARICIRGNVDTLGDVVPRGFIASATRSPVAFEVKESGRRELAEWLTDRRHPLTARVMANRVWHIVFGNGLIRTADNFGRMGEAPSHPELLDYLACRFLEDGWSVKRMIRELLLSRAWGLSTEARARGLEADPENRLLWRAPRRRLDAEAMRDAILYVSGRLDERQRGGTIRPGTSSEFGYRFESTRRSVYLPVFRNALHPGLEAFDFADPNLVIGARVESSIPAQALWLMNSDFVLEGARAAAERVLASGSASDRERVNDLYRRILGRTPRPAELADALRFVRSEVDVDAGEGGGDAEASTGTSHDRAVEAWAGLCHALLACVDFRYLN